MINASETPAPSPATKFFPGVNLPSLSRKLSLICALRPNRIPALGIEPINVGVKPLYKLEDVRFAVYEDEERDDSNSS